MRRAFESYAFIAAIAVCVVGYFVIERVYFDRLPLVMDELDGAYDVYRLRDQVPYRDFKPYKTVLGYYLELPPLLIARDVWSGLMSVKLWLAAINAACMALAAWLASKSFSRTAVALALPCWALMTNWLERSSELRVDTLTAWAGLFSLLFLLRGRAALAGFFAGLSFLISQKGIYYIAAAGPALMLPLLVTSQRKEAVRTLVRFSGACVLTLLPYFLLFSLVASPETTTRSTFMAHHAIAFTQIYPNIRKFWSQTLALNPGFYALTILGLLVLGTRSASYVLRSVRHATSPDDGTLDSTGLRDLRLFGYGIALAAAGIWHKQPWPYFFVVLIPTAFVVCVAAIDGLAPSGSLRLRDATWSVRARTAAGSLLLAALWLLAIAFPIARMPVNLRESNAYQRHTLTLASALVREGEHYLACMDMLYDREQPAPRLQRFSIGRRAQLKKAEPAVSMEIVQQLKDKPPKLLIRTERFTGLTPPIRKHLKEHYVPFWGNIELYAPRISASSQTLELAFAGSYRVAMEGKDATCSIDGSTVVDDEHVTLERGQHAVDCERSTRFVMQAPEVKHLLDPRYKKRRELFPRVYDR